MNSRNNAEMTLNQIYNAKRERWVNMFAADFNSVGANAEDAVAKAFAYAATYLLEKGAEFSAVDLERLVFSKTRLLFKDALADSKRTRGRRSVKTIAVLDEEPQDDGNYHVSLVDGYSYDRYMMATRNEDDGDRSILQSLAIRQTLIEYGKSPRDCDVFDRLVFCASDRKALAAEMKTSVNNINRIHCEVGKLARQLSPQIQARYAKLVQHREMKCNVAI